MCVWICLPHTRTHTHIHTHINTHTQQSTLWHIGTPIIHTHAHTHIHTRLLLAYAAICKIPGRELCPHFDCDGTKWTFHHTKWCSKSNNWKDGRQSARVHTDKACGTPTLGRFRPKLWCCAFLCTLPRKEVIWYTCWPKNGFLVPCWVPWGYFIHSFVVFATPKINHGFQSLLHLRHLLHGPHHRPPPHQPLCLVLPFHPNGAWPRAEAVVHSIAWCCQTRTTQRVIFVFCLIARFQKYNTYSSVQILKIFPYDTEILLSTRGGE